MRSKDLSAFFFETGDRRSAQVNGVELIFFHPPLKMREFHGEYPMRFQQDLSFRTKSFRSGTCASTLLPRSTSARWPAPPGSRAVRFQRIHSVATLFTASGEHSRQAQCPNPGCPFWTNNCRVAVVVAHLNQVGVMASERSVL